MKHVQRATGVLDRGGFVGLPSWPELWEENYQPQQIMNLVSGTRLAVLRVLEFYFRVTAVLAQSSAAAEPTSGSAASEVLGGAPRVPSLLVPSNFKTAILERPRFPLDVTCDSRAVWIV